MADDYKEQMELYRQKLAEWNQRQQQKKAIQGRIQEIHAKAKFDAENFEKRYTTKQKAEIAKYKKLESDVQSRAPWTKAFSEGELQSIMKSGKLHELGIVAGDLPKLSPHPKGQDIGDAWTDKDGEKFTREADGNRRHIPYEKTRDGAYHTELGKIHQHQLDHQDKVDQAIRIFRAKNLHEDIMKEGVKTGTRMRSKDELDRMTQAWMGTESKPDTKQIQSDQDLISKTMQRYGAFSHIPVELQKQLIQAGGRLRGGQQQSAQQAPPDQGGQSAAPDEATDGSESEGGD